MSLRRWWRSGIVVVLAGAGLLAPPLSHPAKEADGLKRIGPAPDFDLTTQDERRISLSQLRGRVVILTFIYASCADTCPLLTAKMVGLQHRLAAAFGPRVFFLSVTVDPERDTPEVLRRYAVAHGANLGGWAFLTGTPSEIREVARRYGVYYRKTPGGDVDHTFLTSVVDQAGILRVQYLGVRFDPDELRRDIQTLLPEGSRR